MLDRIAVFFIEAVEWLRVFLIWWEVNFGDEPVERSTDEEYNDWLDRQL